MAAQLTVSRTGRHKQRYTATGERLLAGCIPLRVAPPPSPESAEATAARTALLSSASTNTAQACPTPQSALAIAAPAARAADAVVTPSSSTTTTVPISANPPSTFATPPPPRDAADAVRLEVLMVSSTRDPHEFVFPKGGWESDESLSSAALRETMEEAGVSGVLTASLGTYRYASKRSNGKEPLTCDAHMFAMRVDAVMDTWPEMSRQRVWVPVETAAGRCRHRWQAEALEQMLRIPAGVLLSGDVGDVGAGEDAAAYGASQPAPAKLEAAPANQNGEPRGNAAPACDEDASRASNADDFVHS